MAKYPYIVNKDGTWYPAGAEVPEGAISDDNKKSEESKEKDFSELIKMPEEKENESYTKTEINRMSTADLKKLASENGIDGAEEMTGGELKKVLTDKFGL